jgi:hypothetical protein
MGKPSNTTYYVDCTGNQKLRDDLLDYAVDRGAKKWYRLDVDQEPFAVLEFIRGEWSAMSLDDPGTLITPATWKRKVRKIWGGMKPTQPRNKGKFAAKPKEPTDRLKHIELDVNRHGVAIAMAIDRIVQRLIAIESSVAVIRSGATFMQQLDKDARQLQDMKEIGEKWDAEEQGLKAGDYCDSSKEVADELTAMGFEWYDSDRYLKYIRWGMAGAKGKMVNIAAPTNMEHLDATTFLSRARVTAKALGLKPVEAPVEMWVPKVGDWVVVTGPDVNGRQELPVGTIARLTHSWPTIGDQTCGIDGAIKVHSFRSVRKATEAEITAHLAAEESKRKEAERADKLAALKFGVRVMTPDGEGLYIKKGMTGYAVIYPAGRVSTFELDDIQIL